jgi:chromosome segregation ATPase
MDLVSAIATGVITIVIITGGLVVVGFVMLFRRRDDTGIPRLTSSPPSGAASIDELRRRAGTLLVHLDDALRAADDELGFAIAQFGPDTASTYAVTLASVRAQVAEAFRLKQSLDDAVPDSDQKKREWTLQIIALCEQAQSSLAQQDGAFAQLRTQEANAASTLQALRERIHSTSTRVRAAESTLSELSRTHGNGTIGDVALNPERAAELISNAVIQADAAAPGISAAGVNAVSGELRVVADAVRQANQLLDAVERTAHDLTRASAALTALRAATRDDLAEGQTGLTAAPDPTTAQGIIDALAEVRSALDDSEGALDPVHQLDRIGSAVARLDLALASARNQAQRLEHARAAYEGTLVSAKSQIGVVRAYIGANGAGVDARTRLAEAERQLMLAEASTDPVEALDTVRRAVTHARDADALARY